MKSLLFFSLFSLSLIAATGNEIPYQQFIIDPYQVILRKPDGKTWQKVDLYTYGNRKLDCFKTLYFDGNAWAQFSDMVNDAKKLNRGLMFDTAGLVQTGDKHRINFSDFFKIWQLTDDEINLEWEEMTVQKFRETYTHTYRACWPFSYCQPAVTTYRLTGWKYHDITYYRKSWQDFFTQVEALEPTDTISLSKYFELLHYNSDISGKRLFKINASADATEATNLTKDFN